LYQGLHTFQFLAEQIFILRIEHGEILYSGSGLNQIILGSGDADKVSAAEPGCRADNRYTKSAPLCVDQIYTNSLLVNIQPNQLSVFYTNINIGPHSAYLLIKII